MGLTCLITKTFRLRLSSTFNICRLLMTMSVGCFEEAKSWTNRKPTKRNRTLPVPGNDILCSRWQHISVAPVDSIALNAQLMTATLLTSCKPTPRPKARSTSLKSPIESCLRVSSLLWIWFDRSKLIILWDWSQPLTHSNRFGAIEAFD